MQGACPRETARDIYRYWGLPAARGAFPALVAALEICRRVQTIPRRDLGGVDAALMRERGQRVIFLARDVRGRRRHLLIAHELAEDWLRRERHDSVETDCDAVARELVAPTWVPGVQLWLAFSA